MRQKRAKAYRRLMQTYSMSFGFRQPYQVLVDSEMCKEATTHKLDLAKQLHNVAQGEVKISASFIPTAFTKLQKLTDYDGAESRPLVITQCCIHELYLQGKSQQLAVDLAKSFERRKCNHRDPIPGDECLQNIIGDENKHRYIVATQSHSLRVNLREIPATPLVHLTRSVMILEPMSDVTLRTKEMEEEIKLHATVPELALVDSSMPVEPAKKRKGPKGPNPLSVKKKRVSVAGPPQPSMMTKKPIPISDSKSSGRKRKADSDGEADVLATNPLSTRKRKRRRKGLY